MFARAGWTVILLAASAVIFGATAVSQEPSDSARREYFEKFYPLVDQSAQPPGQWRVHESGQRRWRTRHGDAVVLWNMGYPFQVWNAMLPGGAAVEATANLGSPLPWRYRLPGAPRRWQHGTVDIRPDGVTFTPGNLPPYAPPVTDGPNLEADLARDEALRRRLADEIFADVLYAYLKNGEFWKEGSDRIWEIGLSRAASLVARMRGHGDTYTDYYPHGGAVPLTETMREALRKLGKPELSPEEVAVQEKKLAWFEEITSILRALGWRRATEEDKATAAVYTRQDLAVWEERASADTPEWAQKLRPPSPPKGIVALRARSAREMSDQERQRQEEIASQSLQKRLYALATSGRITEGEYQSMTRRIRQIP